MIESPDTPKRVLLSSVGTRGDVQPIVGLALTLKSMGHTAVLCVAPNFQRWIESLGLTCFPVGPDLKLMAQQNAQRKVVGKPRRPNWNQAREIARFTVGEQFSALSRALRGCDLAISLGPRHTATHSLAEAMRIPYVYAALCPSDLPSAHHPPPKFRAGVRSQRFPSFINRLLWVSYDWTWSALFRSALNERRAGLGLPPVASVFRAISTDHPWLAADPALVPWRSTSTIQVFQTGSWILPDPTPLAEAVEEFLADGTPPIYFGFGSMQAPLGTARGVLEACRAMGRRVIISRGWGNLEKIDQERDCILVGDVSHQRLFPRVAAVIHHGGSGTTTAAARAGKPQIVIPHMFDQFYFAHRIRQLGIGDSLKSVMHVTPEGIARALRNCMKPDAAVRAQELSLRMEPKGTQIAAERLLAMAPPPR